MRGFETRENRVRLTGDLERGRVTQMEWNRRAGRALGVDDGNLLGRIFADLGPDPMMVEAVARARTAGLKVGLLSNSVGLAPWDMYRGRDLRKTFDAALLSGRCGLRKPEPAMYELLVKMLGVAGEECVFVDDNAENLPPAEALGMATVLHREAERSVARLEDLLGVTLRPVGRPTEASTAARGHD